MFASERTGQFELWRLSLRDSKLTQLTFGALEPRHPAVRPDGNVIAYLESASLEPAAATVVKTLDWRRREETHGRHERRRRPRRSPGPTTAARLRRPRRSAAAVDPRDFRVDIRTEPGAAADADRAEAPSPVRWQAPAPPRDYVVEIGRLFDGVRGTYHRHVDLHVRGGRIAAIVRARRAAARRARSSTRATRR